MEIMSINENWILPFTPNNLNEEEGGISYYLFRFTKIITLSTVLTQIYDLIINGNITSTRTKILRKKIGDKNWSYVTYSDKDPIKLWKDRHGKIIAR
jgi:hypothetical protein